MRRSPMKTLNQLREEIDKIDNSIIKKLSKRKVLSMKIGEIKSNASQKIFDSQREKKLMQSYESLCDQYQLNPDFVKKLFKLIITNSRELQK